MCFSRPEAGWAFEYPPDRLLRVQGIIDDKRMRHPDMVGQDGEPCLLVVKHGHTTGTTIGRANGALSVVRRYRAGGGAVEGDSLEWAILSYGNKSKSKVFSECGDSGSAIVDINGHMGGMLTGGSGSTDAFDITYATPFQWLLNRIKVKFPNAHLNVDEL